MMEEDINYRKKLFAGWMASSGLIVVLVVLITPSLIQQPMDIALLTVAILYMIILFIWLIPFLVLRAFIAKISESRNRKTV